ncbi:MAG: NRDE family protein [Alphaproteobacteria bacterium]|nr:NRDE family protein [Alphaproteobacteria bacterium]
MCTVIVLRRPGHDWPLILGGNRDEMIGRPWRPPGRHWPDRPSVVAGLDEQAGGSWLGLNDDGVVAVILNREGSLGPAAGKRSRGELVLDALDHADARDAVAALADLDPAAYRSFNMVVADNRDAYWLRHVGERAEKGGRVEVLPIPPGASMITAHDRNDVGAPRIRVHLPRLQAAAPPEPDTAGGPGSWASWEALLASRLHDAADSQGRSAMCIDTGGPFGTVSSALVALPTKEKPDWKPSFLFAAGKPGEAPYRPVGAT